jgi:uncharacterized ferritin-like protein (DUF455 family)
MSKISRPILPAALPEIRVKARASILAALCESDPAHKCERVRKLPSGEDRDVAAAENVPGRPQRPLLVHPRDVPTRGLGSQEGRAALVHAVAHIEFNAINLALDAAWRFDDMPDAFRADWIGVAQDEARHFAMLCGRLKQMGWRYGDFPAHNGLWEAAEKTAHDVLARMALVPRVLEARGLDVTPGMIARLSDVGDHETVAVLRVILEEEVRHVAIGTHWFRYLCAARNLEADVEFRRLLALHRMQLRPPLNLAARKAAGFSEIELASAHA